MSRGKGAPAASSVKGFISISEKSKSSYTAKVAARNRSMSARSSKGRVESRGATRSGEGVSPAGMSTVFTLSQFSSMSTPPWSEKLRVQPVRSDCMER